MAVPTAFGFALVFALAVAGQLPASPADEARPFEAAFSRTDSTRSLFDDGTNRHKIRRGANGSGIRLPYTIGVYSGLYPAPLGFSQGVEGTFPFIAWFAMVGRAELMLTPDSYGYTGEIGLRGTIPLSDPLAFPVGASWDDGSSTDWRLHIDTTFRLGRLFYDPDDFDRFEVEGASNIWGPAMRVGFDYGEYVRIFANLAASLLYIHTKDRARLYRTAIGLEVGIRFCFN